jgi:hypothetical protein
MDNPPSGDPGCYTEHGVSGYGVAVKLTREDPMDEASVKSMAEEMMLNIARRCMDQGARCIGHIKSHVRTEAGTIKADTIGESHGAYSVGDLESEVKDLFMAVNSIVQGIHEDQVKVATLDGVHEVAESRGFAVEKEKEHTYFDEFDFTTSKADYKRQLEEQLAEMEASDNEDGGDGS